MLEVAEMFSNLFGICNLQYYRCRVTRNTAVGANHHVFVAYVFWHVVSKYLFQPQMFLFPFSEVSVYNS